MVSSCDKSAGKVSCKRISFPNSSPVADLVLGPPEIRAKPSMKESESPPCISEFESNSELTPYLKTISAVHVLDDAQSTRRHYRVQAIRWSCCTSTTATGLSRAEKASSQ